MVWYDQEVLKLVLADVSLSLRASWGIAALARHLFAVVMPPLIFIYKINGLPHDESMRLMCQPHRQLEVPTRGHALYRLSATPRDLGSTPMIPIRTYLDTQQYGTRDKHPPIHEICWSLPILPRQDSSPRCCTLGALAPSNRVYNVRASHAPWSGP